MKHWISHLGLMLTIAVLAACSSTTEVAKANTCPPDREREKRIEQQATATLFEGEPVRVALTNVETGFHPDYLAIWTPGNVGKPVIVLTHGPTGNVSSGPIAEMALALNDQGYGTLALQMPVLKKDCESSDTYPQTFPEALARIDAAAAWLHAKGIKDLALYGHWVGNVYFGQTDRAPFQNWIVNGLTGNFRSIGDNGTLRILDIYGSEGISITLQTAWLRRAWLFLFAGTGKQVVIDGAKQNFAGKYDEVAKAIDDFLRDGPHAGGG